MSLQDAGSRRPEIPALTSLRFPAALWVVLFHVHEIGLWKGGIAPYQATIGLGYLGVSFFFVLSGFILVYVYSGRKIPKSRFWQSRFARIYPAYLFSLLVTLPGLLYALPFIRQMHGSVPLVVASFPLLLEAWFPKVLFFWNPVAWSLSVEAFFYLLFPFLLQPVQRLRARGVWTTMALAWAAMLALTSAYVLLRPDGVAHTSSQDNLLVWLAVVKFNPLVRLPEFLLGMAAGALFLRSRDVAGRDESPGGASSDRLTLRPAAVIWAGVAAVVVAILLQRWIPYPVMHTGLLAPAFAAIIFGFAAGTPFAATAEGARAAPGGLVQRLLASRVLLLLGEASYSLYLLHAMPIVILAFVLHLNTSPHAGLITIAFLIGIVLLAIGVFFAIENPLRRLLRPRRRIPAAPSSGTPATVTAAR